MTRRGANATKFADLQVLEPDGLTRAQYDTVRGLAPPPPTRGTREHYTPPPVAPDWRQLGACRGEDVNLFYPHKGQNAAAAKAICAGCVTVTREVEYRCKPDPAPCVCNCGMVGPLRAKPWRDGTTHNRNCDKRICQTCRNANNSKKGKRKQAAAATVFGIPADGFRPGNEEAWRGAVRLEVKAGAQCGPAWTRYKATETQSEAARAIGDHRPFACVLMPEGESDGLVQVRLSNVHDFACAVVEQWSGQ